MPNQHSQVEIPSYFQQRFAERFPNVGIDTLKAFLFENHYDPNRVSIQETLDDFDDSYIGNWDVPADFAEEWIAEAYDVNVDDLPSEIAESIDWGNVADLFAYSHYYCYYDVVNTHPVSGREYCSVAVFRSL